jgi:hypothetical protein
VQIKSAFFSLLLSFFSSLSRLLARERLDVSSEYTRKTGRRHRVYFAPPIPLLCWRTRLFRSVVIPVYSVESEQQTIYTYHVFSEVIIRFLSKLNEPVILCNHCLLNKTIIKLYCKKHLHKCSLLNFELMRDIVYGDHV